MYILSIRFIYLQFKLYDYKQINCCLNSGFLTFLQSAYFSIFSFPRQRLIMMRRQSSHREFLFPFLFTRITPTGGSLPPSDTRTITGHLLVNYVQIPEIADDIYQQRDIFDDEFDITKYFKNIESNRREVVATPAIASLQRHAMSVERGFSSVRGWNSRDQSCPCVKLTDTFVVSGKLRF